MRPPSPVSGPSSCVGAGPRPARLIDAKRAEGSPLIRHSIRRATFPPPGGRLWGRLEAAPAGCLRSLRRGAHRAPAGLPPAAPILPGQARSPRGVCPPIQHPSGGSTNGGTGCGPPPAPDAGAMPKARVSRIGGPGKADCGTQAERMWSRGPAGSVTRRRFACFAAGGKVGRPAGRNPLEAETVGRREAPSSVTASAVTPSPLWGEGFEDASRGRPCAENPALSRQHRTMTSA